MKDVYNDKIPVQVFTTRDESTLLRLPEDDYAGMAA